MEEPLFLGKREVLYLHSMSLTKFGGSDGIRDDGMIESALGSAQNTYHYANGNRFDIAASYAFHLAEAQAFLDGNKRTAIATALTFLKLNGIPAHPSKEALIELYDAMIAIAEKRMTKTDLAGLFRKLFDRP